MAGHRAFVAFVALAGVFWVVQDARAQSFAADGWISGGANALYWTRNDLQEGDLFSPLLPSSTLTPGWEPGVEGWLTLQNPNSPWGQGSVRQAQRD